MAQITEVLSIFVPIVMLAVTLWVVTRYYLKTEKEKLIVSIGLKNKEIITPIRLQAYERLVLLLERMDSAQSIIRNAQLGQTVSQLQQSLITNIREEFDHNLSQQLYISNEAWSKIRVAREAAITRLNEAAAGLTPDAPATELAQLMFQGDAENASSEIREALNFLKNEAYMLF